MHALREGLLCITKTTPSVKDMASLATFPCYKRVHEMYAIANFYASDAMCKLDQGKR